MSKARLFVINIWIHFWVQIEVQHYHPPIPRFLWKRIWLFFS